jgi:hypothetical protein
MLLIAALAAAASTAAAEPRSAPNPLAGLTPKELRAKLGEPDIANGEGAGALWTYRLPDCALLVFFEDKGRGLKVAAAEAGPKRRGEPKPALDACLAGAAKP